MSIDRPKWYSHYERFVSRCGGFGYTAAQTGELLARYGKKYGPNLYRLEPDLRRLKELVDKTRQLLGGNSVPGRGTAHPDYGRPAKEINIPPIHWAFAILRNAQERRHVYHTYDLELNHRKRLEDKAYDNLLRPLNYGFPAELTLALMYIRNGAFDQFLTNFGNTSKITKAYPVIDLALIQLNEHSMCDEVLEVARNNRVVVDGYRREHGVDLADPYINPLYLLTCPRGIGRFMDDVNKAIANAWLSTHAKSKRFELDVVNSAGMFVQYMLMSFCDACFTARSRFVHDGVIDYDPLGEMNRVAVDYFRHMTGDDKFPFPKLFGSWLIGTMNNLPQIEKPRKKRVLDEGVDA